MEVSIRVLGPHFISTAYVIYIFFSFRKIVRKELKLVEFALPFLHNITITSSFIHGHIFCDSKRSIIISFLFRSLFALKNASRLQSRGNLRLMCRFFHTQPKRFISTSQTVPKANSFLTNYFCNGTGPQKTRHCVKLHVNKYMTPSLDILILLLLVLIYSL